MLFLWRLKRDADPITTRFLDIPPVLLYIPEYSPSKKRPQISVLGSLRNDTVLIG